MLSVAVYAFMLSVIMLKVIMLSVVVLSGNTWKLEHTSLLLPNFNDEAQKSFMKLRPENNNSDISGTCPASTRGPCVFGR